MIKRIFPLFLLGSCTWADDLGRHLPTVGERCENWQCMTESGRAKSEANKRALEQPPPAAPQAPQQPQPGMPWKQPPAPPPPPEEPEEPEEEGSSWLPF